MRLLLGLALNIALAFWNLGLAQGFGALSNQAAVFQPDPNQLPNLWQVETGFTYTDPDGLEWTVYDGFLSDLASIPTLAQAIIGEKTEPKFLHAALVHDQYIACKTRSTAATNIVFYQLLKLAGVDDWRAETMYNAVNDNVEAWSVGDEPMALCPNAFLANDEGALNVQRAKASEEAIALQADIDLVQSQRLQIFDQLIVMRSRLGELNENYLQISVALNIAVQALNSISDETAHQTVLSLAADLDEARAEHLSLTAEVEQLERVLRVESLLFIELSKQRDAVLVQPQ